MLERCRSVSHNGGGASACIDRRDSLCVGAFGAGYYLPALSLLTSCSDPRKRDNGVTPTLLSGFGSETVRAVPVSS